MASASSSVEAGSDSSGDEGRSLMIEDDAEILSLSRQIDDNLEAKANTLNLTPLNVKSILRHLIQNPSVLSMMGISGLDTGQLGDEASVKLTRAKAKALADKGELRWSPQLRSPQAASRTFLDVEYVNEDEDDDYDPSKDAPEEDSDEDSNRSSSLPASPFPLRKLSESEDSRTPQRVESPSTPTTSAAGMGPPKTPLVPRRLLSRPTDLPALHTRSREDLGGVPIEALESHLPALECGDAALWPEPHADPEWLDFLAQLRGPGVGEDEEEEDGDYNYAADEEREREERREADELRQDRATAIPRREVKGLLSDLFHIFHDDYEPSSPSPSEASRGSRGALDTPTGLEESALTAPISAASEPLDLTHLSDASTPEQLMLNLPRLLPKQDILLLANAVRAFLNKSNTAAPGNPSIGLFIPLNVEKEAPPNGAMTFTPQQRLQLAEQMRMHTQLALQGHLGCQAASGMSHESSQYLRLLVELGEQRRASRLGPDSAFEVENLLPALRTLESGPANLGLPPDFAVPAKLFPRRELNKIRLSGVDSSVVAALAGSGGVLYAALLPTLSPRLLSGAELERRSGRPWLKSEDVLLAHGLRDFAHWRLKDRVGAIRDFLLPVRTPAEIKERRKTLMAMRQLKPNEPPNPVVEYEATGDVGVAEWKETAYDPGLLPIDWDSDVQPPYLQYAAKTVCRGGFRSQSPQCIQVQIPSAMDLSAGGLLLLPPLNRKPKKTDAAKRQLAFPAPSPPPLTHRPDEEEVIDVVIGSDDEDTSAPPPPPPPPPPPRRKRKNFVPARCEPTEYAAAPKLARKTSLPPPLMTANGQGILRQIAPKPVFVPATVVFTQPPNEEPIDELRDAIRGLGFQTTPRGQAAAPSSSTSSCAAPALIGPPLESVAAPSSAEVPPVEPAEKRKKKRSRAERIQDGVSGLAESDGGRGSVALAKAFLADLHKATFMHRSTFRAIAALAAERPEAGWEELYPAIEAELLAMKAGRELKTRPLLCRLLAMFLTPGQRHRLSIPCSRKSFPKAWTALRHIEGFIAKSRSSAAAKLFLRGLRTECGTPETLREFLGREGSFSEPLLLDLDVRPLVAAEPFRDEGISEEVWETVGPGGLDEESPEWETLVLPPCPESTSLLAKTCACPCHQSAASTTHCQSCQIRFVSGVPHLLKDGRFVSALAERQSSEEETSEDAVEDDWLQTPDAPSPGKAPETQSSDTLRQALVDVFGSSRLSFGSPGAAESDLSVGGGVFLRGAEARNLMLQPQEPEWTLSEDEALLGKLDECGRSLDKVLASLSPKFGRHSHARVYSFRIRARGQEMLSHMEEADKIYGLSED